MGGAIELYSIMIVRPFIECQDVLLLETVHTYVHELAVCESQNQLAILPEKKHGCHLLFGGSLNNLVQMKVQVGGGVVTARIAIVEARGIIMYHNISQLVDYGRHINHELTVA